MLESAKESGQDQRAGESPVCGGQANHLGPRSGTERDQEGGSRVDGHAEGLLGETGDPNPGRSLGRGAPKHRGWRGRKTDVVTLFVCFVDAEGVPTTKVAEVVREQ